MANTASSIVIVSMARTPIAKFCGSFSTLKASELGSIAIRGALDKVDTQKIHIPEAIMGNVVSAGMGQAPCRQAVLGAGLSDATICTTINKVCASGMKSVMMASQTLMFNNANVSGKKRKRDDPPIAIIAGGMESMSNIPHYMMNSRHKPTALGHTQMIDGVIHDGLWDLYNDQHMGMCAEHCAKEYGFSRKDQDEYAILSYQRAQEAAKNGHYQHEIVPVTVPPARKGGEATVVKEDEEPAAIKMEKLPKLRPAFDRSENGTVTAANASSLNDGAAALLLMREKDAAAAGITPLARIRGFADAAQKPIDFTTTPSLAVPLALENAGLEASDIDYYEINEAFSVVALANMKRLGLDASKVNVFGGAVALGHPIGMSGARIICTLYSVLKEKDAKFGCASVCNGGGGASAIVIERL